MVATERSHILYEVYKIFKSTFLKEIFRKFASASFIKGYCPNFVPNAGQILANGFLMILERIEVN